MDFRKWIDIAHSLRTSYNDFFEFIVLVLSVNNVIEVKDKNNCTTFDEAVKKCTFKNLYKNKTILKVIKNSIFIKNNEYGYYSNTLQDLKKYLIGKSKLATCNGTRMAYNIQIDFLKDVFNADSKTGISLFAKLMTLWLKDIEKYGSCNLGIEDMLISLINDTNELDDIEPEELQRQLIFINAIFENYLEKIVFNILYKDEFTQPLNYKIMPSIKDLEENKENIASILSFNYTCILPIYMRELVSKLKQPNGKLKTANVILGINIDDVVDSKKERYKLISKEAMRIKYSKKFGKNKYGTLEKHKWMEFLDDEGNFLCDKFLESNGQINEIRIYGHSLGTVDYNILKPLLTAKQIKKVYLYIFVENKCCDNYEDLLKSNQCQNLLNMIYGKNKYEELSLEQKKQFKNKYELKSANKQVFINI